MRVLARLLRVAVLCVALLALTAACASGYHVRATRPVRELPRGYDVAAIQAPSYPGEGGAQTTSEALIALVDATLPRPEGAVVEHDPALDDVAAVVATTLAQTEQLPVSNLTSWILWQAGVTGQLVATHGTHGSAWMRPNLLDEHLKKHAAAVSRPVQGVRRFGVARVFSGGHVGQALIVVDNLLDIEEVPKTAGAGEAMELKGRFHVPVKSMSLFIDDAPTKVRTVEVKVAKDGRFAVSFPAPEAPGAHYLELAGLYGQAPEQAAKQYWRQQAMLLPIYVDAPLPALPDEEIRQPAPNPAELDAFADTVLARYNAARAEIGVAPLVRDDRLVGIAQRFADESRDRQVPEHDGRIARSLAEAGLAVRRYHQIATRFDFLEEDVWGQLRSPSMRLALLDPELTHIGLGFAKESAPHRYVGRTVFVMPVGKLDPERERQAFIDGLNQRLEARGRPALESDEGLTGVVQAFAERVCRGELPMMATDDLQREIDRQGKGRYERYTFLPLTGVYVDPDDDRSYAPLLERPAHRVGVGVCQGKVSGRDGAELALILIVQDR